jgi:repressor LexA
MIREWIDQHGYPPTIREIGAAVGLESPSSVAHQLKVLEERGYIRRGARGSPEVRCGAGKTPDCGGPRAVALS